MKIKVKLLDNNYEELFLNIKDYFNKSANVLQDARNKIKVVEYKNNKYVIKSFREPNIFNKIIYSFLKKSKARKSYDNSNKISTFVPKAIGYIEFYEKNLLSNSYFVSEVFEYDFTIREPLLDTNFFNKETIFKEFAKFTYSLHQNDILHLDYSPGNILIKKTNNSYIFKIVDINRMVFKTLSLDDRLKNFSKLWAKDEDLSCIVEEYSKLINMDKDMLIEKALFFSQKHKNFKNLKKRIRGQEIND